MERQSAQLRPHRPGAETATEHQQNTAIYRRKSQPGKQQKHATSDQTASITANTGKWKTYYTPLVGKNGGTGKGFWTATTTGQITSHPSLKGKRTTSKTKVLYANIKK